MNIAVCIKQTPDTETRIKITADAKWIVEEDIQWIINPYDEAAVEQALQLTEAHGGEVTIIALGPERIEKAIREALAMGAHQAIRLDSERVPVDSLATARALIAVLQAGGYDLVFMGQQAVDGDNGQVPQFVAQALNLPCVTAVEALHIEDGKGWGRRSLEGLHERVAFSLPAVIGVNLRLVEPRYPSFRGIMQAKKKPIDVQPAGLGPEKLVIERLFYPPEKAAGKRFDNGVEAVPEVVRLLREEARVI
jgi:electron transfer flavoprotein beta subunit